MHRILKFVEREVRGLHETAYLLSLFALLSTVLAFFRDRLLAGAFGAGATLDIYYAAFRIPDIVFVAIASLVSVFILVPALTRIEDETQRHELMGTIVAAFSVAMLVITSVLYFAMPTLVQSFFPTLHDAEGTLITLSRILLLQPIFLGLSGILAAVTQIHGRYILYAIAPLLYNTTIIIGIVALYPIFGLPGIAMGVVLGAVLHMSVQLPFIMRIGYLKVRHFSVHLGELWSIVSVAIPRTLTMAASSIALFVLVIFAATLGAGAVSVFSLAFNLQSAPLSIIGASYSVAAFPILTRYIGRGETDLFCSQVIVATRHILFWSVPLIGLVAVLRAHVVRVVLGTGAFDWADTRLTAAALALFIIALASQALSLLFVRGYYAAGETRKPLVVNVLTALGTVGGAYALIWAFNHVPMWKFFIETLLRVEDLPGAAILMLPLSFALFSIINAIVYVLMFERDFGVLWAHINKTLFDSFAAAIVGGFVAREMLIALGYVFDIDTFIGVFTLGALSGTIGAFAAWGVYWVLKSQELGEISGAFQHRLWKFAPLFTRSLGRRSRES